MSTESTPEPTSEAAFFTAIRSWGIVRGDQRVFGGVLSGVGARIGMAPAPTRILFVLLAIVTGGLSLLAYAAAWALLPDAEGRIIIQDFGRGRPNVGSLVAIGVMGFFGFITLGHFGMGSDWRWWDNYGGNSIGPRIGVMFALLIPLAVVGGIIALIVWSVKRGQSPDRAAQGYARRPDGTLPEDPSPVAEQSVDDTAPVVVPGAAPDALVASAVAAPVAATAVQQPPYAPVPPVYSAPPRPPKPRVPGPGKVGYLLALAWIPITIAITVYLYSSDKLAVFPVVAAGVIYVAGLGVILMITALRGRKLGFLGFVSVMALIPVGVAIGAAPEIREHYADDNWFEWGPVYDSESVAASPVEVIPPFDPTAEFDDYATVAIDGSCWAADDFGIGDIGFTGTVALSSIPADQTITVTSDVTRLIVPEGTDLNIVSSAPFDAPVSIAVTWLDRDVYCDLNYGSTTGVQLSNGDDVPELTVLLNDTQNMGSMSLYIEEN